MVSYDKVILKRLRFKGEPDVPEISPAEIGLAPPSEIPQAQIPDDKPAKENAEENESEVDERTEAEKRFARQTAEQEMRRLRNSAATTYKQQVEKFNERLAAEPEHYDMFKISFTK